MDGAGGAAADLAVGDAGAAQGDAEADGALIMEDGKAHRDVLAFHVGQVVRGDAGGRHQFIDRMAAPQIDELNHRLSPRLPVSRSVQLPRIIGGAKLRASPSG